jgi:hypothetical protein
VIFRCHNRIGTKTFADPKYVQAKNVPFDRAKLGADAKNVPESLFALGKPYHSFTLSHIFQEVEKVLRRAMAGRQTTMLTETSAINAQFSSILWAETQWRSFSAQNSEICPQRIRNKEVPIR